MKSRGEHFEAPIANGISFLSVNVIGLAEELNYRLQISIGHLTGERFAWNVVGIVPRKRFI